jgi:hypothetical protein
MEDMGSSHCHHCEGYTDNRSSSDGKSVCSICGGRKVEVSLVYYARNWVPHWEDVCDPIGIDEELRMYELDTNK